MSNERIRAVTPTRPQPGTPREYRFPPFRRERLENGLEVMVSRVPRLPLVTILVLVDAGASTENVDEAGVANLTARGLAEGTQRMDGAAVAEEFERLGGGLVAEAGWDTFQARTTVLGERFRSALELLGEVVLEPAFPEREMLRLRDERLAELLERRAEPRGLADDRFLSFVYREGSRFALPETGSEQSIGSLTRDHCLAFHGRRVCPSATTIIVAGDVEHDVVLDGASAAFGGWNRQAAPLPRIDAMAARDERAALVVARPQAPQSEVRVGHVGIPRSHPDYFPVTVMNAILGGLFNSRVNLNLRERHGYTYGAFSSFEWRRAAGPFTVATAVATPVTAPAVAEVVSEIERMRESPPTEVELSLATSYLAGVFPLRFETTDSIARALAALKAFDLPGDYYDTYRDRIRAVDEAAVHAAARRHLRVDMLQVLAVGDAEQIAPALEAQPVGRVHVSAPG